MRLNQNNAMVLLFYSRHTANVIMSVFVRCSPCVEPSSALFFISFVSLLDLFSLFGLIIILWHSTHSLTYTTASHDDCMCDVRVCVSFFRLFSSCSRPSSVINLMIFIDLTDYYCYYRTGVCSMCFRVENVCK